MTITARYSGTCRRCGGAIVVGEQIEWSRDGGSCHLVCGRSSSTSAHTEQPRRTRPARRSATRPAQDFPAAPPVPGAVKIECRRRGRDDRGYHVGGVVHAPRVSVPGGGPDGHYYRIVASILTPPHEDSGHYSWMEYAWVVAATDEEAAPVAARIAARASRDALARELRAIRGERLRGAQMPADAAVLVPRRPESTAATGERVAIVDGAVWHERCGDPDQADTWMHYIVRIDAPPELLARVAAYIAEVAS